MTNIHSKKCNYGESATIKHDELLKKIDELEKKLSMACKALDTIRKANNFSIKSKYGLLFASQYAGKVLNELKEAK